MKYRPILGRWFIALSTDCRPPLDRQSVDCRATIDRYIDRVSTDIAVDITYSKHDPAILHDIFVKA